MFLKLFLIQKEAGGRVFSLEKVFSSLRKAVVEVLVLGSAWARECCLCVCDTGWDCLGTDTRPWCSPVLTCPKLSPGSRKFPHFHLKYPKGSWDSWLLGFSFWLSLLLALLVPPMDSSAPRSKPLWRASVSRIAVLCTLWTFIFLSRCFAAVEIFLRVCLTSPWHCLLLFSGCWQLSLCSLLQSACLPKSPPSPPQHPALATPGSGFSSIPMPVVSLSLTVAPSRLNLLFQFISSALISCLRSQMYLSKQTFSAFPSTWVGGGKATLMMPSQSWGFSVLLCWGISTYRMEISHSHPVKCVLKHPGSCDTAYLALIKL